MSVNQECDVDCYFHFIGIGGIGMSGLAELLLDAGKHVSGSDLKVNERTRYLSQKGAKIFFGHKEENVPEKATVIYSTDIKDSHPEYLQALKLGCPIWHRSKLLNTLMQEKTPLLVTGTHGKTSTSALLAHTLLTGGYDPSFAIGGILKGINSNAKLGKGPFFIAEADESDGSFLNYAYSGAIVTNIDSDHMSYFKSKEVQKNAFSQFLSYSHQPEILFICGDDPVLSSFQIPGTYYGFSPCSWQILEVKQHKWCSSMTLSFEGAIFSDVEVALIGRHNALNACAVFGLCYRLGMAEDKIRLSFKTFPGVARRADQKGERGGILFIDDYAHHPTEIQTTLNGIKQAVSSRRLVALFEPHRYSRTIDCLEEFKGAFQAADEVLITDIDPAGESVLEGVSKECFQTVVPTATFLEKEGVIDFLLQFLRPGDVLVTLGAGAVTQVGPDIYERLSKA